MGQMRYTFGSWRWAATAPTRRRTQKEPMKRAISLRHPGMRMFFMDSQTSLVGGPQMSPHVGLGLTLLRLGPQRLLYLFPGSMAILIPVLHM